MEIMTGPKKPSLTGMTASELEFALGDLPSAKLRAKQIARQIYRRAEDSFEAMKDLPAAFREELEAKFTVQPLQMASRRHSTDEVDKLLVHNGDDNVFECVLLPYEDRVSCCISSQVGCPMGCKFCATGLGGFDRNLSAGEIIGQYLMLQRLTDRRISHVVFMGMGEPMLNFDNVVKTLRLLHDEVGLSYRHLTVSTVGIVPAIYKMADLGMPIHLALSLHSPFDEVRDRLMPVNHKWKVQEAVAAMREYARKTGRKVTFEYLLIKDVTDTPEQAHELSRLVKGFPCFVNLIPFNWVDTEQGFARPTRAAVREFRSILESARINVTERVERGHEIAAACGQLAGQHKGRFNRLKAIPVP